MAISRQNLEDVFDIQINELIYEQNGIYIKQKNKDYYQKLELAATKYEENEFGVMEIID